MREQGGGTSGDQGYRYRPKDGEDGENTECLQTEEATMLDAFIQAVDLHCGEM